MCGFEITKEESLITIRNGIVAQSGGISIGASVGPDNSFICFVSFAQLREVLLSISSL